MTNNTNMHRIAVVATTSGEALRACDREHPFSRRAWLTSRGLVYYREPDPRYDVAHPFEPGPHQCGHRMDPPPRLCDRQWRRCSANHGSLLVPTGGQGYIIEAETGAEWHQCDCPWAEEVAA